MTILKEERSQFKMFQYLASILKFYNEWVNQLRDKNFSIWTR